MKVPKDKLDAASMGPNLIAALLMALRSVREFQTQWPEVITESRKLFREYEEDLKILDRKP